MFTAAVFIIVKIRKPPKCSSADNWIKKMYTEEYHSTAKRKECLPLVTKCIEFEGKLGCPRTSPGKNTGVGRHSLLQGIFPTQGSNLGLPHCRWVLYHLSHQGQGDCCRWKVSGLLRTVKFGVKLDSGKLEQSLRPARSWRSAAGVQG